jgi:hypothetical protein
MCECWINQYTWWGGPIHSDNSGKFLFLILKKQDKINTFQYTLLLNYQIMSCHISMVINTWNIFLNIIHESLKTLHFSRNYFCHFRRIMFQKYLRIQKFVARGGCSQWNYWPSPSKLSFLNSTAYLLINNFMWWKL